ncbi:hypothetical protein C8J56DRAFT_552788 [Mycena floridula]|nr:hypothetical protein C8J56DRAFT_552788 [Mycena floridula]
MSSLGTLHFLALLGADDPAKDGWMATDLVVISRVMTSVTQPSISRSFSIHPFRTFRCADADGYFKYGDDGSDRVQVLAPDDDVVNNNGAVLKNQFLATVKSTRKNMKPVDTLLIFIAGHGDEQTGQVWIGSATLSKFELSQAVGTRGKVFLWSTACFSGSWIDDNMPWYGYTAASSTQSSDSISASESQYCRGGVNTLTTLAELSEHRNILFPPRPHGENPEPPKHYLVEPTALKDAEDLPLNNLAIKANEIRRDLTYEYEGDACGDPRTKRGLPFLLSHELIAQFKLVPCTKPKTIIPSSPLSPSAASSLVSPTASSSSASPPSKSARVRQNLKGQKFPCPKGIDVDVLVDLATPLIEASPTNTHLRELTHHLELAESSVLIMQCLWAAFQHRQKCKDAIDAFLQDGPWETTRLPRWNQFVTPGADQIVQQFIAENENDAEQMTKMLIWNSAVWHSLSWTDIRIQFALAWDAAGRPVFSFQEFVAVADGAVNVKKVKIVAAKLKPLLSWSELRFALNELGPSLGPNKPSAMTTSQSWPQYV